MAMLYGNEVPGVSPDWQQQLAMLFAGGQGGLPPVPPVAFDEPALAAEARDAAAMRLAKGQRKPGVMGGPEIAGGGIGLLGSLMSQGATMDSAMGSPSTDAGVPAPAAPAPALAPTTSTNDPTSHEPQVFEGGVPMPRPDPRKIPDAAEPMSLSPSAPGAPAIPAAAPAAAAPPGQPGGGLGLGGILGNLFKPENAPLLLAMGQMAGAPSLGTGIRRASAAAIAPAALLNQERTKTQSQAELYRSLTRRGVPAQEALAALKSPELMKALTAKYFETKPAQVVNGRMVRERPDGTVEELADYSTEKAPSGYARQADGSMKFIPGGPADPAVKRALGDRQNAPAGYEWVDPADSSKGLRAIVGGPAEKVDANVAARLGLAKSFLGQLPSIRAGIEKGDATGPWDAAMAKLGVGRAGEIRRQIQSGSEALLRNLTGAGMNREEAANYASRYQLQPTDSVAAVKSKLDQLERELSFTMDAVGKGRGGNLTVGSDGLTLGGAPAATPAAAPAITPLGVGKSTTVNGVTIKRIE